MKKQLVATILVLLTMPFIFVACVSTLLKDSPPSFSSEIRLSDPPKPFLRMNTSVYPSWKSTKSGNVISIISDCDPNAELTLTNLHYLIENSLYDVKVIKTESATVQKRPALYKNITAELDGHTIELHSFSFRQKSCGYVSSLSGKKDTLQQDRTQFDKFNESLIFE